MRKLIFLLGMTVFGWAGWWAGESFGLFPAFFISMIGNGIGFYAAKRFNDHFLYE